MLEMQDLEHARRETCGREAFRVALGAQWRLRRVLEHHGVAGHERRNYRVYGDQVGVIPGRYREHHAERLAPQEPVEARLRSDLDVGQCLGGDAGHVAGALEHAAHFVGRVTAGSPYLPGQFRGNLGAVRLEGDAEALDHRRLFRHRYAAPLPLRELRALQRRIDLGRAGRGPFGINAPVDRADGFQHDNLPIR